MTNINESPLYNPRARKQNTLPALLLDQWYRLTSPPPLSHKASFAQRETARRGRLTSIVLLFLIIVLIILLPIGIFSPTHVAIIAICGGLFISFIALLFNRFGLSNAAGLLITSYVFTSVCVVILNSPAGLNTTTLGLFYTLVFVEVLAVSLLPVNWVLLAAIVNIAFVIGYLSLQMKALEYVHAMPADFYAVVIRVISLHAFVVLVLWLWVRSATQAIKRADRAEELAMRERQIQELQMAELQQKDDLEKGIELILQTHIQVSNGNFQARAPLSQDSLLWQIAHSLNNLIGRLQHYSQKEAELTHARQTIARLTEELQAAKKKQRPGPALDHKDIP